MAQPEVGAGEGAMRDESLSRKAFPNPARAKQSRDRNTSFFIVLLT